MVWRVSPSVVGAPTAAPGRTASAATATTRAPSANAPAVRMDWDMSVSPSPRWLRAAVWRRQRGDGWGGSGVPDGRGGDPWMPQVPRHPGVIRGRSQRAAGRPWADGPDARPAERWCVPAHRCTAARAVRPWRSGGPVRARIGADRHYRVSMTPETVELFYAILALLAAGALAHAGGHPPARDRIDGRPRLVRGDQRVLRPNALSMAFLVALLATLGSLYFSEVAHFEPCRLCWYQRIAMYPLVGHPGDRGRPTRHRRSGSMAMALAAIGGGHRHVPRRPRVDPGARHRRLRPRAVVLGRLVPRLRLHQPADPGPHRLPVHPRVAGRGSPDPDDADDRDPADTRRRTESLHDQAHPRPTPRCPSRTGADQLRLALAPAGRGRGPARRRGTRLVPRPGRFGRDALDAAPSAASGRRRRRRRAGPPVITGTPLPAFTSPTDDPAMGMAAPGRPGPRPPGRAGLDRTDRSGPDGHLRRPLVPALPARDPDHPGLGGRWRPAGRRRHRDGLDRDRADRAELSARGVVRARGLDGARSSSTRRVRSRRPTASRAIRTSSSSMGPATCSRGSSARSRRPTWSGSSRRCRELRLARSLDG